MITEKDLEWVNKELETLGINLETIFALCKTGVYFNLPYGVVYKEGLGNIIGLIRHGKYKWSPNYFDVLTDEQVLQRLHEEDEKTNNIKVDVNDTDGNGECVFGDYWKYYDEAKKRGLVK